MVWDFVSGLLKNPNRIRTGIDRLIEQDRTQSVNDSEQKAKVWEQKLAECVRLRSAYQDQQAAGLMTLKELRSNLDGLEATRRLTAKELEMLSTREERARELEADRDALMASYEEMVPEALDGLTGEERNTVYRMLRLEVKPDPEGYEVSGEFRTCGPTGKYR